MYSFLLPLTITIRFSIALGFSIGDRIQISCEVNQINHFDLTTKLKLSLFLQAPNALEIEKCAVKYFDTEIRKSEHKVNHSFCQISLSRNRLV